MWSEEGEYLTNYSADKKSPAKKSSAVGAVLSASQMRRQLEQWEKKNPDNAAYDNDGNPIERDK
jgi:hypothetical protein